MILKKLIVGDYCTNCYLFGDEVSNEIAIIDPGYSPEKIINEIRKNDYKVKYIIITHGHFDHVTALPEIKKKFDAPIMIHDFDKDFYPEINADILLQDNMEFDLGQYKFKIFHTPGHTGGGICILFNDVLFSGDTLFKDTVGRTDFPTGNFEEIKQSIEKLYELPNETDVYPGHGFKTTIGYEKENNKYVRAI